MRTFDDFLYVCNTKVFLIVIISLLTTFLCGHFGLTGDMPTSLIGIAVVFPIVFSINTAFQRRDRALELYGVINANLVSIFFNHIHWCKYNKLNKKNIRRIKELYFEITCTNQKRLSK